MTKARRRSHYGLYTMAAAEEISVEAPVAALLSERDAIFKLKRGAKNSAEGFSCWTTRFCFTSDWIWQKSEPQSGDTRPMLLLAPTGSLKVAKLAVTNLLSPLKCVRQFSQSSSELCLPFPHTFHGLICEIKAQDLGNVPSGAAGYVVFHPFINRLRGVGR